MAMSKQVGEVFCYEMAEIGKIVPSRAGLPVALRVRYVCGSSINSVWKRRSWISKYLVMCESLMYSFFGSLQALRNVS
jgi:hypothetical protein